MDQVCERLQVLKDKGFNPRTILDIGANIGNWTKNVKAIFSESKFLMIEANIKHEEKLLNLKSDLIDYDMSLLSNKEEYANFYCLKNPTGSSALETGNSLLIEKTSFYQDQNNLEIKTLKTKTLDNLLKEKNISNVDFIKLDIQGAELLVLEGSKETLKNVKFCLLETHMQQWNENAPLVYEVINFMKKNNFILYDICSLARVDNYLINSDFLFKNENEEKFILKF